LAPDSSALFVLTDNENLTGELAIMRQLHVNVLQTNLPDKMVESLRTALGDK
jgi:uncharacterized membrane protein